MCCVISYPQTRQYAFFTGPPEKVGEGALHGWIIAHGPADYASCKAAVQGFLPQMNPFNFTASPGLQVGEPSAR